MVTTKKKMEIPCCKITDVGYLKSPLSMYEWLGATGYRASSMTNEK